MRRPRGRWGLARGHSCNAPGEKAKYDRAEEDVKDGAAN
jgi:hypothetical protein